MDAVVSNSSSAVTRSWFKRAVVKVTSLVLTGLILGWAYNFLVPRFYGPKRVAGFQLGFVHGALMPVALPSLLLGKDVPIYTPQNTGRTYKIGYIAGINVCGFIFFGLAFARPRRKSSPEPDAGS